MLAGARTLVTGAGGFIGANLVRGLLADGAEVIAVLRPTTNPWRLRELDARIRIVRADIRDLSALYDLPSVDVIYHLATAAVDQRVHDVPAMLDTNVCGTYAVLAMAERLKVGRLIHLGSSGEYGPAVRAREDQVLAPNAEYGATKAASTLLVHAFSQRAGLSAVTLRPFSVFGPFESPYRLVPYCALRALDERPIEVTDGSQTRDYVFVDDVVRGLLMAAAVPAASGGTFNLCTGISTSVRHMVLRIAAIAATRIPPVFGAKPQSSAEMWKTSGDPERAARVLGWRAETPLDDALGTTIEWFRRAREVYTEIYAG